MKNLKCLQGELLTDASRKFNNCKYWQTAKRTLITTIKQQQSGKTIWAIADDLRGTMNAMILKNTYCRFCFYAT